MNKIVLIGRLTKAPELRSVGDKNSVCSFTLAVDRPIFKKDAPKETDFINIVVWNKRGESCAKNLDKGSLISVEGRLEIRKYTDKRDNSTKYATQVVANEVKFLERKKTSINQSEQPSHTNEFETFEPVDADDIPF